MNTDTDRIPPTHPGRILRLDFMEPLDLTVYRLAKEIGVPIPRVHAIVQEKRAVTADTALRLARYFRTSAEFWMSIQSLYELETARDEVGPELEKITPRAA